MTAVTTIAVDLPTTSAEQWLAGCAVFALDAARMAAKRTHMADYFDSRCWEVIVAATSLPNGNDLDDRIASVAAYAEISEAILRHWVDTRPVLVDSGGGLARKVRETAERRRQVLEHVRALEALGAEVCAA
jgi:hypothetical protein